MLHRFLLTIGLLLAASLVQAGEAGRIVFVRGDVQIAGQPIALEHAVQEGDELTTGADGHAYLKTIDNGFLILRPNSRARIAAYHVDQQNPAKTRIKLELLNGVARSISGEAVMQSRQNFRFNTPVAAIGIRGTDFTVSTDQITSRIAVITGGVVVSGFSGSCSPEGNGPCEGNTSRELFADQAGQILQVDQGHALPQQLQGNGLSPDDIAPPLQEEPSGRRAGTSTAAGTSQATLTPNNVDLSLDTQRSANPLLLNTPLLNTPPELQRQIIWGRWETVLDQTGNIDIAKIIEAKGEVLAIAPYFAVLRTSGIDWQAPTQGTMGFALKQSEAYILNEPSRAVSPAKLENGQLQVDFARASFATSFDLVSQQGERFKFQAYGDVARDGRLFGDSQFTTPTNMAVSGAIGPENGGMAAYIFQGRIDDNRVGSGVTSWIHQ